MAFNKVIWGDRDKWQIEKYRKNCNHQFQLIGIPDQLAKCLNKICDKEDHKAIIDELYNTIVSVLSKAAEICHSGKKQNLAGWNKYVKHSHSEARISLLNWIAEGKPSKGPIYENMCKSKQKFKTKLKWCKKNQDQIRLNIIASHNFTKNFDKFWKISGKSKDSASPPESMNGVTGPKEIANLFKNHFNIDPPFLPDNGQMPDEYDSTVYLISTVTSKDIVSIIKKMERGKIPGHDYLSIEHLKYAGAHLPPLLAQFYNLCFRHSYLPESLIRTIVVPVAKNKLGDVYDKSNYKPKSLATILAVLLDSLLDHILSKHVRFHDAQFGSKPNYSVETALLCAKQIIRYYTDRRTETNVCFLNLRDSFDWVSHEFLWYKLCCDTFVPMDVIALFKYWYGNQMNSVKWGEALSEPYKLKCGLRQGSLTSSRLFNIYINELIREISKTYSGCWIGRQSVNAVSYGENMVLITPAISALRTLLNVCEKYATDHGLKYDVSKTQVITIKAKGRCLLNTPPAYLYGKELAKVPQFKFLGHWFTRSRSDSVDIERARKALAKRSEMLATRFKYCSKESKILLFKAYCQTFFGCSLWLYYRPIALKKLKEEYHNAFRKLMGLPRGCNISTMLAKAGIHSFKTILRKQAASLRRSIRGPKNSLLSVFAYRFDCPFQHQWSKLYARTSRQAS